MPSSGRWLVFVRGGFRRLRAATFFFHGEKEGKTPPGTAQMSADALVFAYPTPSVASRHLPLTGGVGPGPLFTGDALLFHVAGFPARKI